MHKGPIIKIKAHKPLLSLSHFARKAASETVLMLKNDNDVLPLKHKKIAVFGRIQAHYYKSGTGSGGLVNVKHVPSIIESLIDHPLVEVDKVIYKHYQNWLEAHPYDAGNGQWASEPWAQEEMTLSDDVVRRSSKLNDVAVVVFGRTAGEDKDSFNGEGSYLLSSKEETLLKQVTTYFKSVVVVLNIGNIMDLSFLDRYKIDGLLIAWHGGMYGALALTDCITGLLSPSAKLPMTVVKDILDYPSHEHFGTLSQTYYTEDIYVGYRYFETFNQAVVRYPFGFGLTYTTFQIERTSFKVEDRKIEIEVKVTNTGHIRAKEVVQVYLEAPQGLLGKAKKVLVAYKKTMDLLPKNHETILFTLNLDHYASYDDLGIINKSSYILESGDYHFYVGSDVRVAQNIGTHKLDEDLIVECLTENLAPEKPFKRLKPTKDFKMSYEDTPLRTKDYEKTIQSNLKNPLKTNHLKRNLLQVMENHIDMDDFIGSLSVDDLIYLTRGEGMSSPKVTPGTAAAFGGVTTSLLDQGIPLVCAADGPSGIRMDSGAYASSLPSGTGLASSFNDDMVQNLYYLLGLEMRGYEIDTLLGPGMNIQRHPLNGRNFEYFSEDPLLTGQMASAYIKGLHLAGVDGSLKHFACNNQETDRFNVDAVVSERALREIYLKGFEIAVKYADAKVIMTAYNPINGIWTASNYELTQTILRDEWGFDGLVMTDWWAKMNDYHQDGSKHNTKAMIKAVNDIYMVVGSSYDNSNNDNTKQAYERGELSLYELQRVAQNILGYVIHTPAFYALHKLDYKLRDYRVKSYFDAASNLTYTPATLDNLNVGGQTIKLNPFETMLQMDQLNDLPNDYIYNNHQTKAIKVYENNVDRTIYELSVTKKEEKIENSFDIKKEAYIHLSEANWQKFELPFKKIVHQTKNIIIKQDMLETTGPDAIFYYGLQVLKQGKYIIEIEINVDAPELAQVPFSIYVDHKHETTLTLRPTGNEFITTRAFIIAQEGHRLMHFKFNQGGIRIKRLDIIKHG